MKTLSSTKDTVDARLVVVGGTAESDDIQLDLPATLGRARECAVTLPHPLVSRRHCELFAREGRLFVRDLGSTNGTFVGSERVDESRIEHGQLLTIGTVTFRALLDGLPFGIEPPKADTSDASPCDDTSAVRIDENQTLPLGYSGVDSAKAR